MAVQIVGYDAGAGERDPALLVAADGEGIVGVGGGGSAAGATPEYGGGSVERVPLTPEAELSYTLKRRRCAGVLVGEWDGEDDAGDGEDDADGDGGGGLKHRACPNDRAPYCADHADDWVCARCTGTCLKSEMDCFQEHAVYLAAFAPAEFKVGVTRLERLRRRWREQGAERAAHVHSVSNGRIAREVEAEIAADVGDSVRVARKVAGLGSTVDEAAWHDLLADVEVIETVKLEYGLDLDRRPVADTLATGTVRGVKGRVLVLDRGGTTYAVDMRELVGHVVTTERTDRELQASLGAFG